MERPESTSREVDVAFAVASTLHRDSSSPPPSSTFLGSSIKRESFAEINGFEILENLLILASTMLRLVSPSRYTRCIYFVSLCNVSYASDSTINR